MPKRPEPQAPPSHSGKLNVRLPVELHATLASEAKHQGISLNTLIISLLAGGIGWRATRTQRKTKL